MALGIMGAMPEEINHIKQTMLITDTQVIGQREYHIGTLHKRDVVLVFSRWGKVAASITATTLITRFNVEDIIFTGVAGAVAPELNIGDIVIADKLIQHDMNASPLYPRFMIPLLKEDYFPVAQSQQQVLQHASEQFLTNKFPALSSTLKNKFNINQPKVVIGTIASGDEFINDEKKLTELANNIDNLKCVEMEGAAVAQVCHEHQIPFSIVRIISDKANHSANIDFVAFIREVDSFFSGGVVSGLLSIPKLHIQ